MQGYVSNPLSVVCVGVLQYGSCDGIVGLDPYKQQVRQCKQQNYVPVVVIV